jgi:hypothetical protein
MCSPYIPGPWTPIGWGRYCDGAKIVPKSLGFESLAFTGINSILL